MSFNCIPSLRYRDPKAAIDFLQKAFGFEPKEVYEDDGTVVHAELVYRGGMVMLGAQRDDDRWGNRIGMGWTYVVVDDADAHHDRAKAAGAEIVMDLEDQDYGSRDYAARDPEGNFWSFGTYSPSG